MNTKKRMTTGFSSLLLIVMVLSIPFAGAEEPSLDVLIDRFIVALKEYAPEEQISWEVMEPDPDVTYLHNATSAALDESDLEQEEALRIAVEAICTLSDLTIQDIFNDYDIEFYFYTDAKTAKRYWYITILTMEGKMIMTDNYNVEILSPDGTISSYDRYNND